MRIIVDSIPHEQQRYDTTGDWQFLGDDLVVRISEDPLDSQRHFYLTAIHEIIEAILCKAQGISEQSVDFFDMAHSFCDDPGRLRDAPYHQQHMFAMEVELTMGHLMKRKSHE
jgi:hypothetical protein